MADSDAFSAVGCVKIFLFLLLYNTNQGDTAMTDNGSRITKRSQLLDFVQKNGPMRRTDIVKYLREVIQGKTFDRVRDRGYWSTGFRKKSREWDWPTRSYVMKPNAGFLLHETKSDKRRLTQDPKTKLYSVTVF